jgi:ABC-2 type transport system ATP-binding protein
MLLNPQQLQVTINRQQNLNTVFVALSNIGIQVTSMRNKTNRLEELFIDLVQSNQTEIRGA